MGFQHVGTDTHALGTIERERPQIGAGQSVLFYNGNLCIVQGFGIVGNLHTENMGRPEESVGMVLQTENSGSPVGLIGAYAFEHPQPVVQGMRQHMHLGISPGHHLTIEPDYAVTI